MNSLPFKQLSAWLPVAMSLMALSLVAGHLAMYGITRGGDEGAAARIFQLLLLLQIPLVIFFAAKWLPRAFKEALLVLALQVGLMAAAITLIIWLEM